MVVKGRVTMAPQPLVGAERDELTALVMRLKTADERTRTTPSVNVAAPVRAEDLKWAEDWQLPREVFEYFVLEHSA